MISHEVSKEIILDAFNEHRMPYLFHRAKYVSIKVFCDSYFLV